MKKFFHNKTDYQGLRDLEIKISEYDRVLVDFKNYASYDIVDYFKILSTKEHDWNRYLQPLELKFHSTFYDVSGYVSDLIEEEIDREVDSVGYARQLKRKRRALIELQLSLQKNRNKLVRIRKRILKSVYKYNVTHDYRQDLKQVLRKHMPLSIDEEENSSIVLLKSFKSLNALIELLNKKIKSSKSWIKTRYLVSLNEYLSRKNCRLKTKLH